jgi:hypothetical protein
MVRVASVRPLDGLSVELTFIDGLVAALDLEPYLRGPVFEPVRGDPAAFRAVRVDDAPGTIVWPNDADMDPDVLHARALVLTR